MTKDEFIANVSYELEFYRGSVREKASTDSRLEALLIGLGDLELEYDRQESDRAARAGGLSPGERRYLLALAEKKTTSAGALRATMRAGAVALKGRLPMLGR